MSLDKITDFRSEVRLASTYSQREELFPECHRLHVITYQAAGLNGVQGDGQRLRIRVAS